MDFNPFRGILSVTRESDRSNIHVECTVALPTSIHIGELKVRSPREGGIISGCLRWKNMTVSDSSRKIINNNKHDQSDNQFY